MKDNFVTIFTGGDCRDLSSWPPGSSIESNYDNPHKTINRPWETFRNYFPGKIISLPQVLLTLSEFHRKRSKITSPSKLTRNTLSGLAITHS